MAAPSYRFLVSGRVQGVFFRQSTADLAQRLGLCGWVRNLPDGRVEGLASGPEEGLARLREWLSSGPPAAQVSAVHWEPADPPEETRFVVRRGGASG